MTLEFYHLTGFHPSMWGDSGDSDTVSMWGDSGDSDRVSARLHERLSMR